jgi:hypothetical protein
VINKLRLRRWRLRRAGNWSPEHRLNGGATVDCATAVEASRCRLAASIIAAVLHIINGNATAAPVVAWTLDTALGHTEEELIKGTLSRYAGQDLYYHALRTRQAGVRSFISFHVLVPGEWTVSARA